MRKPIVAILVVIFLVSTAAPALAGGRTWEIGVDVLLVRPISLAAIVIGTAVFVVSLPFSIPSRSVEPVAQKLVAEPFKFTFTRPIGSFPEYIGPNTCSDP